MSRVRGLQAAAVAFALIMLSLAEVAGAAGGIQGAVPIRPVLLSPIVQISVTGNLMIINAGQSANVVAAWSGGTPPYTVMWYSGQSQKCQSDNKNFRNDSVYAARDLIIVAPPNTTWYCAYIIDSAHQTMMSPAGEVNVYVPSTSTTVTTSAPTTTAAANATSQNSVAPPAVVAINSSLCDVVNGIRNIVGVLSLALFLLGGVLYAVSHFLPQSLEFKKSLTTWSTAMIIGAVIALVIVLAAKPLLTMIVNIAGSSGGSALNISC
jgi:hypothetical protein